MSLSSMISGIREYCSDLEGKLLGCLRVACGFLKMLLVSSSKFSLWIEGSGVLMVFLEGGAGVREVLEVENCGFALYMFLFSK